MVSVDQLLKRLAMGPKTESLTDREKRDLLSALSGAAWCDNPVDKTNAKFLVYLLEYIISLDAQVHTLQTDVLRLEGRGSAR